MKFLCIPEDTVFIKSVMGFVDVSALFWRRRSRQCSGAVLNFTVQVLGRTTLSRKMNLIDARLGSLAVFHFVGFDACRCYSAAITPIAGAILLSRGALLPVSFRHLYFNAFLAACKLSMGAIRSFCLSRVSSSFTTVSSVLRHRQTS